METLAFKSSAEFRTWLETNHDKSGGFWLRIYKANSGRPSITYAEALDQALCFGWIDGQKRALDDESWLQKWTPRQPRSGWSKKNTEHVERLTASGQMMSAGLRAVAAAKADGRWKSAYDSPRNAAPPQDFLDALKRDRKAKESFESLNRANVYAIVYRLQTAKKPETRQRRLENILAMLNRGETFH